MLPSEISVYILKIRNNIRNNASKKIQHAWKEYLYPEFLAIDLALEIEIDEDDEIIVTDQSTVTILKYCLAICSGKYNLKFWKNLAVKLSKSLIINSYDESEYWLTRGAINYRKTKIQYKKLLKKFNFSIL